MAPEILKTRRYETATDVWAFGCVLAHMGTGKIPYQQLKLKDRNELFNVIRGGEVSVRPTRQPEPRQLEPRAPLLTPAVLEWSQPIQLLLDAPNTPSGILNVAKSCCMPEAAQRPSFQSIAEQLNAFFADDADPRPLMRVKDKKVFTAEARSASGLSLPLANSGHDSYRNKFRSKSALSPRPDGPLSPRSSDGASPGSHRAYTRRPSVAELDASALPISSAARSLMERRKSQEVSAEALESYRTMSPQNSNRQMSARSFLDSFSSTLLGTFTPGKEADAVSPDTAPPAPVSPVALPQSAALPQPSQPTADVEPTPKKSPVPAKAAAPSKAPPLNLEQMAPAPRAPAALESAAPTNAGDVMATFRDDATFRGDATFRAEDDEKKGDTTIKI
jgi:serine/threonine protein kinase